MQNDLKACAAVIGQTITIDGWTSDPQGNAKVATVYHGLGRADQQFIPTGSAPHLNYQTSYVYDALDDLRKVIQGVQGGGYALQNLYALDSVKGIKFRAGLCINEMIGYQLA